MGALSHFSILGFDRMAETQLDSTLLNPSPLLPLRSPSRSFSSILLWYHHNQPTFEGKRSLKITYTKLTHVPNDPNSNFPEFFIQTLRIIFLFIVENLFVKLLSGRTSFFVGERGKLILLNGFDHLGADLSGRNQGTCLDTIMRRRIALPFAFLR